MGVAWCVFGVIGVVGAFDGEPAGRVVLDVLNAIAPVCGLGLVLWLMRRYDDPGLPAWLRRRDGGKAIS